MKRSIRFGLQVDVGILKKGIALLRMVSSHPNQANQLLAGSQMGMRNGMTAEKSHPRFGFKIRESQNGSFPALELLSFPTSRGDRVRSEG